MRNRRPRVFARAPARFALAALALLAADTTTSADHRDGPLFENTAANGRADIGDLYVFRGPAASTNTVFILTVSPFAGNLTPKTFDEDLAYEIKIDKTGDAVEDLTFQVTFGPPDGNDIQDVILRALPSADFPNDGILARAKTGQNVFSLPGGGGTFRASLHDDPFFFDQFAWDDYVDGNPGPFPRPVGQADNFYGANDDILAIVLEVPSSRIGADGSLIGVWGRVQQNGVQLDRAGKPWTNLALIPPVPRNNLANGERRTQFNTALPKNDVADFGGYMKSVLQSFWGQTSGTADAFVAQLLPDMLIFQISNANGYNSTTVTSSTGQTGLFATSLVGNGRKLRDDVIDICLNSYSSGAIATDNVPSDSNFTDGVNGAPTAFPYLEPANNP